MTQPRLFGFLIESFGVRDVREYAEPLDAVILQYRDRHGLEVDLQEKSGARPCFRTHTITRYSSTPPRFR